MTNFELDRRISANLPKPIVVRFAKRTTYTDDEPYTVIDLLLPIAGYFQVIYSSPQKSLAQEALLDASRWAQENGYKLHGL